MAWGMGGAAPHESDVRGVATWRWESWMVSPQPAARARKLPYTDAALDDFVAEGATAASATDLDALDDDEYDDCDDD